MDFLFKAGMAFAVAALLTGSLQFDTPRWRAVAAELHSAQPQARLRVQLQAPWAALSRPVGPV